MDEFLKIQVLSKWKDCIYYDITNEIISYDYDGYHKYKLSWSTSDQRFNNKIFFSEKEKKDFVISVLEKHWYNVLNKSEVLSSDLRLGKYNLPKFLGFQTENLELKI